MGEQRFMRDRQILEMSEMEWSVLSWRCCFTCSAEPTGDVCVCVLFLAYDCVRLQRPAGLRILHAHWCFSEGGGPNWLYLSLCVCAFLCARSNARLCVCVHAS